ncbi:hypothetical protein ABLG96_04760 [Nakamurella sp. A5-74]|uniref:Uncharacterized protein n=1 Tax=Nakamurella sp. A5-74 TaxID=3158264 RepID=A0AAU8DT45_9ACTN
MRTTSAVTGVVTAALLILTGCGSDTTGAVTPTAAQTSATTSSAAMAPSQQESADASATSSQDSSPTTVGSGSTTAQGTEAGGADEQSVAWFDTLCSGLGPVKDLGSISSEVDRSDPIGSLQKLAPKFAAAGTSVTQVAKKLSALPGPTFAGGKAYAAKVTRTLATVGPKLTAFAKTLPDLDPDDPASRNTLTDFARTLQDAAQPLIDLGSLPAEAQAAPSAAPACQALGG